MYVPSFSDISDIILRDIILKYQLFLATEKQLSKHTIEAYILDLRNLLDCLIQKNITPTVENIKNLTIVDFRAWISSRIKKHSGRSNNRAISAVSTFFKYCQQEHCINNANINLLKKAKTAKLLPRTINNNTVTALIAKIASLHKKPWQNMRDEALFLLIFSVGLRISEALMIKKSDIFSGRDFFYVQGKGAKQRIIPLLPIVKEKISTYLAVCPFTIMDDDIVFISNTGKLYTSRLAQRQFQIAKQLINLPEEITPHALRHSCATILFENSDDIIKIKHLLGHSQLSTTQIYTKVAQSHVKNALHKIGYWKKDNK